MSANMDFKQATGFQTTIGNGLLFVDGSSPLGIAPYLYDEVMGKISPNFDYHQIISDRMITAGQQSGVVIDPTQTANRNYALAQSNPTPRQLWDATSNDPNARSKLAELLGIDSVTGVLGDTIKGTAHDVGIGTKYATGVLSQAAINIIVIIVGIILLSIAASSIITSRAEKAINIVAGARRAVA